MILRNYKNGFTLTELLVVLIILGVIVSMGIPGYMKTVEKERERLAVENLKAIYEAQQLYRARHGAYMPITAAASSMMCFGLDEINDELGLDLVDKENGDYMCYTYAYSGSKYNYCFTKSLEGIYQYYIHIGADSAEPCCINPAACLDVPLCSCLGGMCQATPEL